MAETSKSAVVAEAAWRVARLEAPDCTPEERAEFEQWRQGSPERSRACADIQGVTDRLDWLAISDVRLQEMADQAYAMGRDSGESPVRRGWRVPLTLAASLVVAIVGVRLGLLHFNGVAQPITYANTTNERQSLTLQDGTRVQLDVGSRIDVRMSARARRVDLVAGRALFSVTHDASRPFSVAAGAARTTDLGTEFQVARRDNGVEVTLAEGSVDVTATTPHQGWHERLVPGEQLQVSPDAASRVRHSVDPSIVTSWSRGRLVFRATPLGQALDEVNLYANKKVHLADPSLAALTVSGSVVAGDGGLAASAFAAVLPVHVIDGGSEIILFPDRGRGRP